MYTKKICFITTIPITLRAFVLKTAEYIHTHTDWDISFVCSDDEQFSKELPEYIHYYPVYMERGINFSGIKAMLEIKKIFQREKFDLIQYSTPNASLYASLAGWLARVPIRLYCQWGIVYVGFDGFKRRIFKMIEKVVCFLSTDIEPDSYSNLKFAHEEKLYPKTKGSVIWNGSACGINLEKFNFNKKNEYRVSIRSKYNIPMDAFVFGYIGRITRDKGINELFTAFRSFEKDENVYLMMVGEDKNDLTIDKELFEWSKKHKRVIYTGYTDVVEQYLSAMDIYILPSYREGFGMGTIEAEAMGVPVIVTNIPGPIDAMQEGLTGLTVEKKSASSLLNAMKEMYENPDKVESFKGNAVNFAINSFEQKELFDKILKDRIRIITENNHGKRKKS